MNAKKNNEFKIGEIVVYPKHGVGEIMNIETMEISNIKTKFYVKLLCTLLYCVFNKYL